MSKTVATYVRAGNPVNSELFLKQQAMRVQEYCEKQGYIIADTVQVVGSRNLGLQMFMKMLDEAKETGIDTVVMETTNRIAGSVVEMLELQEQVKQAGIAIETLDGSHEMIDIFGAFHGMEDTPPDEFDSAENEGIEGNEDEEPLVVSPSDQSSPAMGGMGM